MIGNELCCQQLGNHRQVRSPFRKLIVLGFYDGATSGLTECQACTRGYRFELVTWDDQQDVRIFALAPLTPGIFQGVAEICATLGELPGWPVWIPRFEGEAGRVASSRIDEVLGRLSSFELLVASEALERDLLVARPVKDSERGRLQQRMASVRTTRAPEWFAALGLEHSRGREP